MFMIFVHRKYIGSRVSCISSRLCWLLGILYYVSLQFRITGRTQRIFCVISLSNFSLAVLPFIDSPHWIDCKMIESIEWNWLDMKFLLQMLVYYCYSFSFFLFVWWPMLKLNCNNRMFYDCGNDLVDQFSYKCLYWI